MVEGIWVVMRDDVHWSELQVGAFFDNFQRCWCKYSPRLWRKSRHCGGIISILNSEVNGMICMIIRNNGLSDRFWNGGVGILIKVKKVSFIEFLESVGNESRVSVRFIGGWWRKKDCFKKEEIK
jgi:hypothetical protein